MDTREDMLVVKPCIIHLGHIRRTNVAASGPPVLFLILLWFYSIATQLLSLGFPFTSNVALVIGMCPLYMILLVVTIVLL